MKLHVDTMGEGPEWVLLHGWGCHSGIWGSFAENLAEHAQVTLIDLPGFGYSSLANPPTDLNTVVDAVLAAAPDKATWLGWSLGGLIAQAAAISAPDRVNALKLITSSPCFKKNFSWPGIEEDLLNTFMQNLDKDYKATLNRFLSLQMLGLPDASRHTREVIKRINRRSNPIPEALTAGLSLLANTDLRLKLGQIACPTLQIYGRLDRIVPVEQAEHLRALLPDANINIIAKAAHIPFLSHEEEVLKLILR